VTTVLAALTGISGAVSLVVVPELFPGSIRATGMAIAYAVGVSIFGGTTQFIITWLIGITHLDSAPAWYVVLTSIISIIAMLMMPETGRRALED
jgi:hypothetical protein